MATVSMWCPKCQRPLYFDESQVGSTQQCPSCYQAVIVPALQAAVVTTHPSMPMSGMGGSAAFSAGSQERSVEQRQARRINMTSGCFAMLAVMFAVGVMGAGIAVLSGLDKPRIYAITAMAAGLGGLIAFVFFGYIATETASSSHGREHRS